MKEYAKEHLLPKVFKQEIPYDLKRVSSATFIESEIIAMKSFDKNMNDVSTIDCFNRLKHNNYVFTSSYYDSDHLRCSSYAKWKHDGLTYYGQIQKLVIFENKNLFIAKQFIVLNLQQSLNISTRYKQAFEICKLEDYFTIVSNKNFSYICLPITCLITNCIHTQIPNESFGIMTEVFNYQHD